MKLFLEGPDRKRFETDVPDDTLLGKVADDFTEARGLLGQYVIELVGRADPGHTMRLDRGRTAVEAGLRDGDVLRITPDARVDKPDSVRSWWPAKADWGGRFYHRDMLWTGRDIGLTPVSRPAAGKVTRRYSDVNFPDRVEVNEVAVLRVGVGLTPTHPHDIGLDVELPTPVVLTVNVAAENFTVESQPQATITVPVEGTARPAVFLLRGLAPGPGRVMVDYFQNGRPLGSVDVRSVVGGDAAPPPTTPGDTGGFRVRTAGGPEPDVVLIVHQDGQVAGRLHFTLYSRHPGLRHHPLVTFGNLGSVDLRQDVAAWTNGHLTQLNLDPNDPGAPRRLQGVGNRLYQDALPKPLQELCWVLAERRVESVMVLSDEPHVPWEMVKPYRDNPATGAPEQLPFWGESFALTRWLRGPATVDRWDVRRVDAAADPAAEELDVVRRLADAGRLELRTVPRQVRDVEGAFHAAGFDVFHLASHGTFAGAGQGDGSAVEMADGPFEAGRLVPDMRTGLRRTTPLVVFNACTTGRLGYSLTRLGSWAGEFVHLGCGGFVGTQWVVTARAATVFARAFYRSLLEDREPVGRAAQLARLAAQKEFPDDPSWLAYSCFADPLASVAEPPARGGLVPAVRR